MLLGVDLSNYALEDLLAFDDIFLDYFNNFLKNPTFAQPIQYNRYLGIFEEIDSAQNAITQIDRLPKYVSLRTARTLYENDSNNNGDNSDRIDLNDVEQNKLFDWVRTERLALFFRTHFFRDFKLCNLLVKPLSESRPDSTISSQLIGGYSRQSPPISTSLSTEEPERRTTDYQATVQTNLAYNLSSTDQQNQNNFIESLNILHQNENIRNNEAVLDLNLLEKFNRLLFQRPGSRAISMPSFFPIASMSQYTSSSLLNANNYSSNNGTRANRKSTSKSWRNSCDNPDKVVLSTLDKHEHCEDLSTELRKKSSSKKTIGFSLRPLSGEFDELNVKMDEENNNLNMENLDNYDIEFINEEEEEEEDENVMENKFNIRLDTNILANDDELLTEKETLEANSKVNATINQYKTKFLGSVNGMNEFKNFLKPTSGYRLLKFWLDCEFYRDSMQDYDEIENMATRNRLFRDINEKYVFGFARKMHEKISKNYENGRSLTHSLFDEIQYDILRRLRTYWVPRFIINKLKTKGKDYGAFPLPPLTPDYGRQSTYLSAPSSCKIIPFSSTQRFHAELLNEEQKNTLYDKVKQALLLDKDAGGPFLRYISTKEPEKLPLILFWYDVCDFNSEEMQGYDRSSRLQHALAIYNSYLSPTARFNIGIPLSLSEDAHKHLRTQNSSPFSSIDIYANVFQPVMEQMVTYLLDTWLEFIKDDVSKFTESKLNLLRKEILAESGLNEEEAEESLNLEENKKIPDPELVIENNQIFVKRPWIQDYLFKLAKKSSNSSTRKQLTEEERLEREEKRKKMEIERKKALRRAMRRAKMNKLNALGESEESVSQLNSINYIPAHFNRFNLYSNVSTN